MSLATSTSTAPTWGSSARIEREPFRLGALPAAALDGAANRREQRDAREERKLREYVLGVEAREEVDAQLGDVEALLPQRFDLGARRAIGERHRDARSRPELE